MYGSVAVEIKNI